MHVGDRYGDSMFPLYIAALFGFIGGFARALIGLLKNRPNKSNTEKFMPGRIAFTLLASAFIGLFTGLLFNNIDYRIVLLAGYAGTDIVEGLYKAWKKEPLKLW
jgi:fluoride ion exporter CrcB/FEX